MTQQEQLSDIPLADVTKEESEAPKDGGDTILTDEKKKEHGSDKKSKFLHIFSRDRSAERTKKQEQEQQEPPEEHPPEKEETVQNGEDAKQPMQEGEDEVKIAQPQKDTKKPKAAQWFHKKTKPNKEQRPTEERTDSGQHTTESKPPMTIGLNMLDRDETSLNDFIKLNFENVFAEPDGYHGADCNWRASYVVFTKGREFIYKALSLLFGIPCAIIWAILFAIIAAVHIWGCVPAGRILSILGHWPAQVWKFIIRSVFDPCFRSIGLCFSSIHMHRHEVKDQPANVV